MTDDLLLTAAHFASLATDQQQAGLTPLPRASAVSGVAVKPLSEAVAELEGRAIREAMLATGGNKLAASRLLGISRATLYEKLPLAQREPGS
jgi:DNA-binding NtrC family response regulator